MSDRNHEDLHASRVWDRLKDQLGQDDKRDFLNLYYIYSSNSIINCRKAELHIMLGSEEDDQAALALLENNDELLAFGLKAKLLAVMPEMTGLEEHISQDFGNCSKEQDFEGAIHFEGAKLQYYYAQAEYSKALRCAQRAESISLLTITNQLRNSQKPHHLKLPKYFQVELERLTFGQKDHDGVKAKHQP